MSFFNWKFGKIHANYFADINPEDPSTERQTKQVPVSYRGVPFDEWLLLFLEYAISLAQVGKFEQAYKVCESARDASIFAKSKEDLFLIHVTWAGKTSPLECFEL